MKLRDLAPQTIHTVGFDRGERVKMTMATNKKAVKILSSTIYKYKIRAIVRELSCNAIDGHIVAGNMNPFDVQLPTVLDPRFIIRDYGTGLSDWMVRKVVTVYFESTKNDTNDLIGSMGLGSKSPFCYTDTFTIESVQDGIKRAYVAYMDDGEPYVDPIYEVDTDEPNGVQITVPVDVNDIPEWEMEAARVYESFTKIRPRFVGVQVDVNYMPMESDERSIIRHKSKYYSGVYARMGDICYPIDKNLFGDTLFYCYQNSAYAYILDFPIGTLDFMPSREELSMDKITKQYIIDRMESISKSYFNDLVAKMESLTTVREKLVWFNDKPSLLQGWIGNQPQFNIGKDTLNTLMSRLQSPDTLNLVNIRGYWANAYDSKDCDFQRTGSGSRYDRYKPETTKRQNITRILYPWNNRKLYVIKPDVDKIRPYIIGYVLKNNISRMDYVIDNPNNDNLKKVIKAGYFDESEIVYLVASEMVEEKELYVAEMKRRPVMPWKEPEPRPKTPTAYRYTLVNDKATAEPLFLTKAEFVALEPSYAMRLYGLDEYSRLDGGQSKLNLELVQGDMTTVMKRAGIDEVYILRNSLWSKIPDSKMRCIDDHLAKMYTVTVKAIKPNAYPAFVGNRHYTDVKALRAWLDVCLDRMVKNRYDIVRHKLITCLSTKLSTQGKNNEVVDPALMEAYSKHRKMADDMAVRVDTAYELFVERNPTIAKIVEFSSHYSIQAMLKKPRIVEDMVKLIRWK